MIVGWRSTDQNKQDEGSSKEKDKKGKKTVANISEDEVITKSASLASVFKSSLPSDDDGEVHVFIASEVITLLSHKSSHDTFIDSGCSHHLSPHHEYFLDETFTTLKKPIKVHLRDASTIQATGKGSLHYLMDTPKGIVPAIISNALYVPELAASLLSVACFTDEDKHHVIFKNTGCAITEKASGRCIATVCKTSGSLYWLIANPIKSKEYTNVACTSHYFDINLLHHCLGHLSHDNIKQLVDKGMVHGVKSVGGHIELCEACINGKQHKDPFPHSNKHARHKLDLIHSDMCGPLPISIGGMRFFIVFCDDNICKVWIYFMWTKGEAYAKFQEFKALVKLQTGLKIKVFCSDSGGKYTLVIDDLPKGRKAVSSKLVFWVKQNVDGSIECFKACLVAHGYSQVPGMDFDETFAPVVKLMSIWILWALASLLKLHFYHLDVDTAFLNSILQEEIYMHLPQGIGLNSGKFVHLLHSIYGLKQASWVWNELLNTELKLGFKQITADYCIYVYCKGKEICFLAVYVDDMGMLASDLHFIEKLKKLIGEVFKIKDLGPIKQLLGVAINYD